MLFLSYFCNGAKRKELRTAVSGIFFRFFIFFGPCKAHTIAIHFCSFRVLNLMPFCKLYGISFIRCFCISIIGDEQDVDTIHFYGVLCVRACESAFYCTSRVYAKIMSNSGKRRTMWEKEEISEQIDKRAREWERERRDAENSLFKF